MERASRTLRAPAVAGPARWRCFRSVRDCAWHGAGRTSPPLRYHRGPRPTTMPRTRRQPRVSYLFTERTFSGPVLRCPNLGVSRPALRLPGHRASVPVPGGVTDLESLTEIRTRSTGAAPGSRSQGGENAVDDVLFNLPPLGKDPRRGRCPWAPRRAATGNVASGGVPGWVRAESCASLLTIRATGLPPAARDVGVPGAFSARDEPGGEPASHVRRQPPAGRRRSRPSGSGSGLTISVPSCSTCRRGKRGNVGSEGCRGASRSSGRG